MTDAQAAPEPVYSLRLVWAAAIAYLLNLIVVLALGIRLFDTGSEGAYGGWVYLGGAFGLLSGAGLWAWTTRFRAAGLVAWAAPCLAVVLALSAGSDRPSPTLGALAGFLSCLGLFAPYWYVGSFPRHNLLFAVRTRLLMPQATTIAATTIAIFTLVYCAVDYPDLGTGGYGIAALVAAILLSIWGWAALNRPAVELLIEAIFTMAYAVREVGPVRNLTPSVGPVLLVANHACWFDPVFVSKALPRPATPMMTARFYSIWFLRPVLKHIFRVIVVPESPMRREAPELKLAIAALDRGECVLLFPEGYLRRKEEVPLRRFGQGVWQILKDRPDTPVVACWVEGGWGAWCSYFNGPPTKNKRMDFRRKIRIALSMPEVVPPAVLADPLSTRIHLMNRVRAMRVTLGLPELPAVELPVRAGDD